MGAMLEVFGYRPPNRMRYVDMTRLPGIVPDHVAGTDDWLTPPYIFRALRLSFDLDPCSPPGGVPWIPAADYFTEAEDGLTQPWFGRVWCNPPYSKPYPWVERLADHGNGIALIPADTSTVGWFRFVPSAAGVLFLRQRVTFLRMDRSKVWSARFASALVAWGEDNAEALRSSGLGWSP